MSRLPFVIAVAIWYAEKWLMSYPEDPVPKKLWIKWIISRILTLHSLFMLLESKRTPHSVTTCEPCVPFSREVSLAWHVHVSKKHYAVSCFKSWMISLFQPEMLAHEVMYNDWRVSGNIVISAMSYLSRANLPSAQCYACWAVLSRYLHGFGRLHASAYPRNILLQSGVEAMVFVLSAQTRILVPFGLEKGNRNRWDFNWLAAASSAVSWVGEHE